MKKIYYLACMLAILLLANACKDDDMLPGNPVVNPQTEVTGAHFGDSLQFTVDAADAEVPLSTLKAQLFYDEEMVSETVLRTKTNAEYSGKIYIPYYANVPNGTATLKFVLQNIHFTITEKEYDLPLTRPDFPYLTFMSADNQEYRMERVDLYHYKLTGDFPQKMKGYIKSPKVGEQGNEIPFGWKDGGIVQGITDPITFSNSNAGTYDITFNTFSYEASPFIKLLIDGKEMEMADEDNYQLTLPLVTGQQLELSGFPDYDNWWIDPDFFTRDAEGKLTFLPLSGDYRITANFKYKYFIVEAMSGENTATLQTDGSGAIWVIGDGVGKPTLGNVVSWTTEKGLCMAPVEKGKYQLTLVAGSSVNATDLNFKFFHQKGWGGEFTNTTLSTTSDIIFVGDGENGRDPGNLGIQEGKSFETGGIYVFTMDVTGGIDKAVLTVEQKGQTELPSKEITLNGTKMEMLDAGNYRVEMNLTQGNTIRVEGIDNLGDWWIDPNYFTLAADKKSLTFLPVNGNYRINAHVEAGYLDVQRLDDANQEATLAADGQGALWIMGWGVGSPSLDNQYGWEAATAYCVPEIAPAKYRMIMKAGPEKGSKAGQTIRFDYLSCKFFHQRGWGGEVKTANLVEGADAFIKMNPDGNIELADGVTLEENATYILTIDCTGGIDTPAVSFAKQ
ncbi:DUF5125 domain-containing protein [Parabacteroides pacaensis]|uniref:DUF5125 domain-containing protein n=1 Tax=Parabacteroides pacaensis TaxID=2086575 RepID=UPI000D10F61E|nr:DUF5125 domain-containing protein [Parabacteroides pacaensis]